MALEKVGNNRLAFGGVVVKILNEPAVGKDRPWDEITGGYSQHENSPEVPGHDRKACEGQYLAEILRAGYPAKTATIGNLVARFIRARIGRSKVAQDAVRVNVQGKSNDIDQETQLKARVLEPVVGVERAVLRDVRRVEIPV